MTLYLLRASPNIEQVEIIGASHKQQEVVAEDEFWAEEGDFEIGEFWALQDFLDLSHALRLPCQLVCFHAIYASYNLQSFIIIHKQRLVFHFQEAQNINFELYMLQISHI